MSSFGVRWFFACSSTIFAFARHNVPQYHTWCSSRCICACETVVGMRNELCQAHEHVCFLHSSTRMRCFSCERARLRHCCRSSSRDEHLRDHVNGRSSRLALARASQHVHERIAHYAWVRKWLYVAMIHSLSRLLTLHSRRHAQFAGTFRAINVIAFNKTFAGQTSRVAQASLIRILVNSPMFW